MTFNNPFANNVKLASTSSRPAKFGTPVLEVVTTDNKLKIYEKASSLVKVETGDYLALINNDDGDTSPENLIWGITKGWVKMDANGKAMISKNRKTGEEEDAHHGSKLASVGQKPGLGQILNFTDANNYPLLKVQASFYDIAEEAVKVEIDGEEREVFILTPRVENEAPNTAVVEEEIED